jgi:hypothetical protein
VAGELVSPKNMTLGSNIPRFVTNTAFHSSPFRIRVVISPTDIKLGEVSCPLKPVNDVGYQGEGVAVPDGIFVEFPVVLYEAKFSILLFNEEHRQCNGRLRRLNVPFAQVFLQKSFQLLLLVNGHRIHLGTNSRGGVRREFYSMVPGLMSRESFRFCF